MKFSENICGFSEEHSNLVLVSYDPDTQCYTDDRGRLHHERDVTISTRAGIHNPWAVSVDDVVLIIEYDLRRAAYKCLVQYPNYDRSVQWIREESLRQIDYIRWFPQQPGVEKPKTPLERLMAMRDELDSIIKELGEC